MKQLSNHEIVTLAVYALGGHIAYVDTEDVAVKANELAPGRFSWRKYREQINLEIVRVYLSDAKKADKGKYLCGSGTKGWMLTEKGLEFAQSRSQDISGIGPDKIPMSARDKQWVSKERVRMLASEAFSNFSKSGAEGVARREAEAFFRVDEYVVGEQRERKLIRILNAFKNDPQLGEAVKALATKVRGG